MCQAVLGTAPCSPEAAKEMLIGHVVSQEPEIETAFLLEALFSGDGCAPIGSTWDAPCWLHSPRDRGRVGPECSTVPPTLKERCWKDLRKPSCVLQGKTHLILQSSQRGKEQEEMGISIYWVCPPP